MHSRPPHETTLVSSHPTSDGLVSYLRCECGAWEVRTSRMVVSTSPRPSAASR